MTGAGPEYAKVVQAATGGYATRRRLRLRHREHHPDRRAVPAQLHAHGRRPAAEVGELLPVQPVLRRAQLRRGDVQRIRLQRLPQSSVGMLIDTSRNGWGGASRPTALNSSPDRRQQLRQREQGRPAAVPRRLVQRQRRRHRRAPAGQPVRLRRPHHRRRVDQAPGRVRRRLPHRHATPTATRTATRPAPRPTATAAPTPPTPSPATTSRPDNWFAAQFQQLVHNAYPALGGSTTGGDTTPPSTPDRPDRGRRRPAAASR